jgi:hypothetical protein
MSMWKWFTAILLLILSSIISWAAWTSAGYPLPRPMSFRVLDGISHMLSTFAFIIVWERCGLLRFR